jgi:hypothetical protein
MNRHSQPTTGDLRPRRLERRLVVILTMIGGVATHVRIGDPPAKMAPPTVLGVLGILLLTLA